MATAEDYCGIWTFRECDQPEAEKVYPIGGTVAIGNQYEDGKLMLAWTDADRMLHVLTGLELSSGVLTGPKAQDLATAFFWNITITTSSEEGPRRIQASVKSIHNPGEGNLTGNWGADAPPRDGDGQPSQLRSV